MLNTALTHNCLGSIKNIDQKRTILNTWKQTIESGKLKRAGEVAIHGDFLSDLFLVVLGYTRITDATDEWTLTHEQKTTLDATKADGALGFFTKDSTDIRAVIELKSIEADLDARQHRKNDRRTPVEQAFSYIHKSGKKCHWVIVSNYREIRLYHADSSGAYERFLVADLTDDAEFVRFYYLLSADNLLAKTGESVIDALYRRSEEEEKNISKRFYAEYTQVRLHVFEHLKQHNPERDELLLLEKTQKLLDRFIFVCFCEDTEMLTAKIFRTLVKRAQESFAYSEEKIWAELKGLFRALDEGREQVRIPKFNGELFKPDPDLDALHLDDTIFDELANITDYDFSSDLNVNILGHIFEQSITDLEDLRADIQGEASGRKQGKRKKDGIFYTPEYITRYIAERAVGGWLDDRQRELGRDDLPELSDADYASIKRTRKDITKGNARIEQHRAYWKAYKEVLMNIKVLDPACGSGAFLNQTFDFLYQEGQRVNEAFGAISFGQITIFDLDKHILSNDLYGVDLNRESVEITKLSLWLKTAKKDAPLTALDNNIKCGNSLIDDPLVADGNAFNWEREFPAILRDGGFDVIAGNPPYVRQELLGPYKSYFQRCYQTYHGVADLFVYFIERGVSLLKPGGIFSIIVSNKWMRANYGKPLRTWMKQQHIQEIIDFGDLPVFEDATTYPCILTLSHNRPQATFNAIEVDTLEFSDLNEYADSKRYAVLQELLQDEGWALVDEQ